MLFTDYTEIYALSWMMTLGGSMKQHVVISLGQLAVVYSFSLRFNGHFKGEPGLTTVY